MTIDCGRDGDFARAVLRETVARGVFIRMPGVAPLNRCIRVSLGDEAALSVFEEVLPQALQNANPLGIQRLVDGVHSRDALS